MRRVLYALLACALPTLAFAQGPLPPPSVIPGVVTCPPGVATTVTCTVTFTLTGQDPATLSIGAMAQDSLGNSAIAIPPVDVTPDVTGPVLKILNVRQTSKTVIEATIEATDQAGVDPASVTALATRRP